MKTTVSRPIHTNGNRWLISWSRQFQAVIVNRENVKETKLVCDSIPYGTHNRKKLIVNELKKRGII